MSKTLSIIVPTYNRAELLRRLLEQLTSQTQPPHEIIIIDDHSTDHTRHISRQFQHKFNFIRYAINSGRHLANARRTGMRLASGEYLCFIDDDVIIDDKNFLVKLFPLLHPGTMIQPKVIMENFSQRNQRYLTFSDILATRPYPILELITAKLNRGCIQRQVFPFNELGVFWHKSLNKYWIDKNLIGDAYGQSYSTALRLREAGVRTIFHPELVLRHPGSLTGGSKKFNKKLMTEDFTSFHYDYFYNMVYLNSRWFPGWLWLWLPYFLAKSLVALAMNHNFAGWRGYALKPIQKSLSDHYKANWPPTANYKLPTTNSKIFIWQGSWRGGAEHITLAMSQYLAKQSFSVTLGVYQPNTDINLQQIKFPRLRFIPQSFQPLAASIFWRRHYADQFAAVYAHTLGAWKTSHNQIFIHEAADLSAKLRQTSGLARKLAYWLWRYLYLHLTLKRAAAIFAATPECAAYLERRGINPQRIKPSASFYDETIFRFTPRPTPGTTINIAFVGNYQDKAKNFALARRLFGHKPHFHLHVIGGSARERDANIIYHGYLPAPQLASELTRASIFFMPSTSEGFSIALLEALATGLPCLVNAAAVPRELRSAAAVVTYKTTAEIPQKIREMLHNYQWHNVHDPLLSRFAKPFIVGREADTIKEILSGSRHSSDKKPALAAD